MRRQATIRNLSLGICCLLLPLRVPAQGVISTNKEFVLNSGSGGTTKNALPPDETNFFAVNSNLLNQSVATGSGGGGSGTLNFATNNLNAVITNNEAGNVTLNGAILSVGGATRLDSSAIFTDGTGDMQINGSLKVSQVDGSPNHIDGYAGGVNLIARQEAFDVWGYGAPGADYDLDLGAFAISNYEGYSVIIGSHCSIQYSSVWQPWTNVTGVASPYNADRGDLQIVDNMSAESGNKEIILPQATVMFADTEQNDMNWTFVRDGAALGPAYYDRWYAVYNLGSNAAHTLSVCTADHIAFTNYGGQVDGTNIQVPNMTKAVFTTFGTNGVVELSPLGPYNAYGSGLSNAIYSIGQANGWGSGGGSGTVTSVAAAADSANVVSWSGSPITGGGTLTPTFAKISSSQFGVGKADGSSITASSGVLSVGSVAGSDITGTIPASALQFATNNANTMVTNYNAGAVQLNGGLNIIGNIKDSGTFTSDSSQISSSGTGNLTAGSFLAVNTPGYSGDGSGLTGLNASRLSSGYAPIAALTNLMYWLTNTVSTSQNYILQYHNGGLQWIETNWTDSGSGGESFNATTNINMVDGAGPALTTVAHGLGSTPSYTRLVLVCTTNDSGAGMSAGQEIDVCYLHEATVPKSYINVFADSVNLYIVGTSLNGADFYLGTGTPNTFHDFAMKVYFAK